MASASASRPRPCAPVVVGTNLWRKPTRIAAKEAVRTLTTESGGPLRTRSSSQNCIGTRLPSKSASSWWCRKYSSGRIPSSSSKNIFAYSVSINDLRRECCTLDGPAAAAGRAPTPGYHGRANRLRQPHVLIANFSCSSPASSQHESALTRGTCAQAPVDRSGHACTASRGLPLPRQACLLT